MNKPEPINFFSCSTNYNLSKLEGKRVLHRICLSCEIRETLEEIIVNNGGKPTHGYCKKHFEEKLANQVNEVI